MNSSGNSIEPAVEFAIYYPDRDIYAVDDMYMDWTLTFETETAAIAVAESLGEPYEIHRQFDYSRSAWQRVEPRVAAMPLDELVAKVAELNAAPAEVQQ